MITKNDESNIFLEVPRAAPHLNIPVTSATVDVRIINSTSYQKTRTENLLSPPVAGHDILSFPSYAFLITHQIQGTHILFDVGMRKDWRNACPPALAPYISDSGGSAPLQVSVEKDVVDILDADPAQAGICSRDIDAVVWSHHHFDHRGDMSRFRARTKLIVGPGLIKEYLHSEIDGSELKGREVIELSKADFTLEIGGYPAHDAFCDGSFFIMSCPGHTVGHLCALARTTSSPFSSYVLLGGDCAHHCGELRPSPYKPLPQQIPFRSTAWSFSGGGEISAPVLKSRKALLCAGEFVREMVHPQGSAVESFYDMPREPLVSDHTDACDSIAKMEVFDAHDDVLVCVSHDASLMSVLPFYPYTLNDWHRKGYKQRLHWEFLNDFDLEQNPSSQPLKRHSR